MKDAAIAWLGHHEILMALAWGAFKALIPLPTPSYFLFQGAELARGSGSAWEALGRIFLKIALPGGVGGVLGAAPYYVLGLRGGWPAVERWAPWLGIPHASLRSWEKRWTERRTKVILVLFAAPFVPICLGAVLAGLVEAGFWRYAVWMFFGGAVRCLLLGLAGWKLRVYGDPAALMGRGTLLAGGAVIALFAVWVVVGRRRAAKGAHK